MTTNNETTTPKEENKKTVKASFKKEDVQNQVAPVATESTQSSEDVVQDTSTTVAVIAQENQVQGEVDQGDLVIPSLRIAQAVGDLGQTFTPGTIIYNGELALSDGPTPVEITVLKIRKVYMENLPYGSDVRPRTWNTSAEMEAEGFHTRWDDNQPPPAVEVAYALVAIKAPDGLDSALFPYEYQGHNYATGMWTLKGASYTSVAKLIFTASRSFLSKGLHKASFLLTTVKEKKGNNWVQVPKIKNGEKYTEEKAAFFASLAS